MTKVNPAAAANLATANSQPTAVAKQENQPSVFTNGPKAAEQSKPQDFNLYGKDFLNFEKFKGNDKHDAMRLTNDYANDVKKAYMQLQHEYPAVVLEFEPMPDPKKCGKKREGYMTYQLALKDWKDRALQHIANQRELSAQAVAEIEGQKTRATVAGVGAAIMNQNGANTAAIIQNQEQNQAALEATTKNEGEKTRAAVRNEGKETRETTKDEAEKNRATTTKENQKTREAVYEEGAFTRFNNDIEAAETRDAVRREARKTRAEVEDEAAKTRKEVKKQGEATRDKVQESIEIDDPTGQKRRLHRLKKVF